MLGFLQKYQKLFFAIVTFAIIASFALFGVLDLYDKGAVKQEDKQLGKLIDDSSLMMQEVLKLSRFIATDSDDLMYRTDAPVNLCNNGVIRRDLLYTGIADLMVCTYFDLVKSDLSTKLARVKNYKPYQNPETPMVSARSVWERFIPSIALGIDTLKEQSEASPSTFSELSQLFMQQTACPPELTRRFLSFYESQGDVAKPDPYLRYADLSLFGFHSASDWFGSSFVDVAAVFILNGAKMALQKGYDVSLAEAKADLIRNFQASLNKIPEKHRSSINFSSHLQMLGFTEKEAVNAWQKVLLFRRYFEGISQALVVDQLPYRDFGAFSRETTSIEKYEWPSSLALKTGQDLLEFQVYLHALGGKLNSSELPKTIPSLETVLKKSPDLVQTTYRAKVKSALLSQVGLTARAKEILDFQLESANWKTLCGVFSFLKSAQTCEERLQCLDKISSKQRKEVDSYVRNKWVEANPDAIGELFSQLKGEDREISVSDSWVSMPEMKKPKLLAKHFAKDVSSFEYREGDRIYLFQDIEIVQAPHILTFAEAKDLGIMEIVTNRFLEAEYKRIRGSFPSKFQAKEGEWKAFFSVKDEVISLVFADLFEAIAPPNKNLAYYATHRLENLTRRALRAVQKDSNDPSWVACEDTSEPLLEQFKLKKTSQVVPRMAEDESMREQLSHMKPGEFSQISVPENGKISFFYFEKITPASEPILEQITLGKEHLGADAKRFVADRLLKKIKQKNAIVIPTHGEKDESI